MSREQIRFDYILGEEFLMKLRIAFTKYLNERNIGDRFEKILKEIYVGNDKINIEKVLKNLDIRITEEEFIQFLHANCYAVIIPTLAKEKRHFSLKEKTAVAAYGMFRDNADMKDYTYTTTDEQLDEYLKYIGSESFINFSFDINIKSLVSQYEKEMA